MLLASISYLQLYETDYVIIPIWDVAKLIIEKIIQAYFIASWLGKNMMKVENFKENESRYCV